MNGRKRVEESKNLKALNPLIAACTFLAILPPNSKSSIYNVYALIVQVAIVCAFLHSAYGKQTPLLDSYSPLVKIIDQIASLFLTVANIMSISITSFCYPKKFKKLLKDITHFDNRVCVHTKKRNLFWICIILFHILMGIVMLFDLWFWTCSVNPEIYEFYMTRGFQFYHLSLTVMLVFWMTVELQYRFKHLNKSLEMIFKKIYIKKKNYPCEEHIDGLSCRLTSYEYNDVKHVAKMYNFLCNVVNDFNGLFGVIILFAVIFFIIYMIFYAVGLIVYGILNNKIVGATFGLSFQLVSFSWIVQSMITLLTLAAAGDHLSVESAKTSSICYRILNFVDISPRHDLELLRGELKLLANQVSCRRPCLNASGFFVVNFYMMGFIITSVTSYIVVAIQFLN